jgi:hypothetical protein
LIISNEPNDKKLEATLVSTGYVSKEFFWESSGTIILKDLVVGIPKLNIASEAKNSFRVSFRTIYFFKSEVFFTFLI